MKSNTDTYERDYSRQGSIYEPIRRQFMEDPTEREYLNIYAYCKKRVPKSIVQKDKEAYERLLKKCDGMVSLYGGKIKAAVSYERWQADIKLTLPFVEFCNGPGYELLRDIMESTDTFCIVPYGENQLVADITIDYFEELPIRREKMEALFREACEQSRKTGHLPDEESLAELYCLLGLDSGKEWV